MENKEKIILAEKGIKFLRQDLARKNRSLTLAIFYLKPIADTNEKTMSTDGIYLFYNADFIISRFTEAPKAYQELQYRYLHILSHCLTGHINKKVKVEDRLYDWCADFYAYLYTRELTGKSRKIPGELRKGYRAVIESVSGKSLNGFLKMCLSDRQLKMYMEKLGSFFASDSHQYWVSANPAVKNKKIEGQMDCGQDGWEWIRKQISYQDIEGRNIFSHGNGIGTEALTMSAEEENESSYFELLKRLCSVKEVPVDDIWEYDYAWYCSGLELYGNKPILEASECVEIETTEDIVLAIDTSASCIDDAPRFLRETMNVFRDAFCGAKKLRVWLLECDSDIQSETIITSEDDIPDFQEYEIMGWGGTSFIPVFQYIRKKIEEGEMQKVSALLYFSDGCGEFPDEKPDYETFFLLPPLYQAYKDFTNDIPEWITTLQLTENDCGINLDEEEQEDTPWSM